MKIYITPELRSKFYSVLEQAAEEKPLYATKYLDFGIKVIRVLCHDPRMLLFLDQQLGFVLRNEATHFDETIIFWQEKDIPNLANRLDPQFNLKTNFRMRAEYLMAGRKYPEIAIMDAEFSEQTPLIALSGAGHAIEAYNPAQHCCYYAVDSLDAEEIIKLGHLFVQPLNVLLKTNATNLTHGAVFGYNGQGVLLCARGQRGKSTLTVHSLIKGCEYVSDDYQLLEKQEGQVYAYPLYSIITLSPQMYQRMYLDFKGKFCSNNARKDKYVFNMAAYHDQFKTRYPIKACLFPEIVSNNHPSIEVCSSADKGRAIAQFIHSTVMQMRDLKNHETIKKLFDMIKDLPFYKFNLCSNIEENTTYLRDFLNGELSPVSGQNNLDRCLLDITFDLANVLDTETNTFYSFNKFATQIYQMLLQGEISEQIEAKLQKIIPQNPKIMDDFQIFARVLQGEKLLDVKREEVARVEDLDIDFVQECGYKLSLLKHDADLTRDLIQTEKGKGK